jgi:integrase
MQGSIYKRCTRCTHRVKSRRCERCNSDSVTWGFSVDVGATADGRRSQKARSGFPTRKAAEQALREFQSQLGQGTALAGDAPTVEAFLTQTWLPTTQPPHVKWKTWRDRCEVIRWYVTPRIGHIRLDRLTPADLNRAYGDLLANGRVRSQGGLSPSTVNNVHRILRKALRDAVRWGLIIASPADSADPPSARLARAARRRAMNVWTAEELRTFLASVESDELSPLWLLATTTGLRRSELLGSRWQDLDFDLGTLTVRQTVVEQQDGGCAPSQDQKSSSSGRTIYIDQRTLDVLRAHRDRQNELRAIVGARWQDHDLIFCRPDGRWHSPDHVTKRFGQLVKQAGVPRIRLHDARHTHASLLLRVGVHPKVVSERLGHSSVSFTLDTYSHVMPGMQPDAAEKFAEMAFGTSISGHPPDHAAAFDGGATNPTEAS